MRRPRTTPRLTLSLALSLLVPIACSGGDGESESTTEPTTGDGTTETTDNTEPLDCGEHLALAGACFEVERHPLPTPLAIVVPGDFDGDGVREYFTDRAGPEPNYGILEEDEGGALVRRFLGWLEDAEGLEIMIYRASGRDYDFDGRTDLFALVRRGDWLDQVWDGVFCGLLLRSEPGFEFSIEARLCGYTDYESDLDARRFDGTFADVDGDGSPELFFAPNSSDASLLTIHADADADERLSLRQSFDLRPLGLQKNIVTVAADLDGDGRDELVLVDGLGKVWTFGLRELSGDLELLAASETPVLPPMAGTVVAHDLDGDGELDLIGAATTFMVAKLTPGEFAIARGLGDGRFTRFYTWTAPSGPSQTSSPFGGPLLSYVHLVVLDLDESGYPGLVYVLPDDKTLVIHPQLGRDPTAAPAVLSLDYKPLGVFRDPQADGSVDLLVTFDRDTKGTDDRDDDEGPYIDRYRLHRP